MTELVKNTFKTNDDIFTNCAICRDRGALAHSKDSHDSRLHG